MDEGRRIALMDDHRDWGWIIVNYSKYRRMSDSAVVRDQTRKRVQKHRDKKRSVTVGNGQKRQAEAEAEALESTPLVTDVTVEGGSEIQETPKQWLEGFPDFWQSYPRKVARQAAEKAYAKLKPRTQATYDLLFAGLAVWKQEWEGRDMDKIPHASTWITQGRFRDAEAAEVR